MRLAQEIEIDQEPFGLVYSCEELFDEVARIGFPCVVKSEEPQRQVFDKKALISDSLDVLRGWFPEWPPGHRELIVQRFASGERRDIHIATRAGAVLYTVELIVTRTDRPDGTGSSTDGVLMRPTPRLQEDRRKFAQALDLTGVFLSQFLYESESDTSHLLEINPRLVANYTWAHRCGMDLPVLAIKVARGEPAPEFDTLSSYPAGPRFARTFGDFDGIKNALRKGEIGLGGALCWLGRSLLTFLAADFHNTTWSWRDPMPTLMIYARFMGRGISRIFRRNPG